MGRRIITAKRKRTLQEHRDSLGIVEELGLLARGDLCRVKRLRGTYKFMFTRTGEATVFGPVDPVNGKPGDRRSMYRTVENDRIKGQ